MLLLHARRRNAQDGLTGRLIAVENDQGRLVEFAQWLEGPEKAVAAAIRRIRADARHQIVEFRHYGETSHRRMPDWDMAYETSGRSLPLSLRMPPERPLRAEAPPASGTWPWADARR